jgi:glycosyltransferase involved in cell wall biosynthesis
MKIAILGTRGIPNHYGGFEQFAENLSLGLVQKGHQVTVYNSHNHCYKESSWNGVDIVHCYDPEYLLGTAGQFIYDLNCILDCRKKRFDVILELGYTSSSVWLGRFLNKSKFVVSTNMDGHEWKRSKYSKTVKRFLKYAEKLAVKNSGYLIADSVPIKMYLQGRYNAEATYIPYGAVIFDEPDVSVVEQYELTPHNYDMLVARLESENSVEVILHGVAQSTCGRPFLVVGNCHTKYGLYLQDKFARYKNIRFLNGIYDINVLNNLRYYSSIYFHGHTVGGTNPSLLEAMASSALICAHDNVYNASILRDNAHYFRSAEKVREILDTVHRHHPESKKKIGNNLNTIATTYTWDKIINQYIQHFEKISGLETHRQKTETKWKKLLDIENDQLEIEQPVVDELAIKTLPR